MIKEEYIKQVTKDLPQWLILKQQKETEDMSNLQKSIENLNESRHVIQDEMEKHMQFMNQLNEKVAFYSYYFPLGLLSLKRTLLFVFRPL